MTKAESELLAMQDEIKAADTTGRHDDAKRLRATYKAAHAAWMVAKNATSLRP